MAKNAPAGPPPITTAVSPLLKGLPAAGEEEPVLIIGLPPTAHAEERFGARSLEHP